MNEPGKEAMEIVRSDEHTAALRERLEAERDEARAAFRKCADKFNEYVNLHLAKGTPEGNAKAEANAELAQMCEQVLTPPQPAPTGDDVFRKHLQDSAEMVKTWPAWKRDIPGSVTKGEVEAGASDALAALRGCVEALEGITSEIRAYQFPECDEPGQIGAEELKVCDEALATAKALLEEKR